MKSFFENLGLRDRLLVIGGGVMLGFIILYGLIWLPFTARIDRLEENIVEQRELDVWIKDAARQAGLLRGTAGSTGTPLAGQSLLALVDRTAKQGKLAAAMKRVEPEGDDKVRIRFEQAVFDDMSRWLENISRSYNIQVEKIAIDRTDPGTVNARMTLKGLGE